MPNPLPSGLSCETIEAFFAEAAKLAARETLPRFRSGTSITNKLDSGFDPVTEADSEAEAAIRAEISRHWPQHGIIGEEHGRTNPDALLQWIIDPIDGTRAFISGIPVWGTLIGLYHEGRPLAGMMSQPFTGELYFSAGEDSYLMRGDKREKLATSKTTRLEDAIIMTTSPDLFQGREETQYAALESACRLARYGCDCYAYALLAAGNIDLVCESGLHIYDIAALIPIIENAGGVVTAWDGGDPSNGGQVLAAANRQIHEQALARLKA